MSKQQNKVKEEFERKFRNKPVGSRLIFGHKKNPFPQHGFKYGSPPKKTIRPAFQRNTFYGVSPFNGFMRVGQPTDGLLANMMLASKFATLDGQNLRGRRAAPPTIATTLTSSEAATATTVATRGTGTETATLTTTGTDPEATAYTPREMQEGIRRAGLEGRRQGEQRILEEVVPEAFQAGLGRRRQLTEQAREIRQSLGMGIRGQPKITPELMTMYQQYLSSVGEAPEFDEI